MPQMRWQARSPLEAAGAEGTVTYRSSNTSTSRPTPPAVRRAWEAAPSARPGPRPLPKAEVSALPQLPPAAAGRRPLLLPLLARTDLGEGAEAGRGGGAARAGVQWQGRMVWCAEEDERMKGFKIKYRESMFLINWRTIGFFRVKMGLKVGSKVGLKGGLKIGVFHRPPGL